MQREGEVEDELGSAYEDDDGEGPCNNSVSKTRTHVGKKTER